MSNCTALTWITVSPYTNAPSNPYICRAHIRVHRQVHFWREKWITVHTYIVNHPRVNIFLISDIFDVHFNPWTTSRAIHSFNYLTANRAPLLLSTEDTCWIGRICNRDDVRRFQITNVSSHGKFMQSQFMGKRRNILTMLSWGLQLGKWDDMLMMYEYIRKYPHAVTMDETGEIFGSLAFASLDTRGTYMCWNGWCSTSRIPYDCVRRRNNICIRESHKGFQFKCPLLWHANGLLSRAFFDNNPRCTKLLGRLK